MGIEDFYADGIEARVGRRIRNPDPPVGEGFSLMQGLGGIFTGLAEQGASGLEAINAFRLYSAERRAEMGAAQQDSAERRAQVNAGFAQAAASARRIAQESAPDPQTAHQATQIIHGLTRFGAKAVGSVVAAGPVGGAALLGAEETNTAYRDLTMRGIDSDTALKVAAVQGAISAAGVVLPISGAGMAATTAGKVAATAGLVAAGGPGAYVAQETLSRDILQRAGYADEAAKHDPTDWLGLGMSLLLPGVVGAYSLRGVRTPKQIGPIKTEAGVRDAVQLTPAEQAASDAFERSAENLAELRKEIARTKDPALRQILEAELTKQTQAAARAGQDVVAEAAARSPEVVDAARVRVLQETTTRSLPDDPAAYPRLMDAIDAVSAGERVDVPGLVRPVPTLADFITAGKWKPGEVMREADGPDTFAGWIRSQGGIDIAEKFDISGEANAIRSNPGGGVFRRGGLPSDELASRAAEAGFMLPDQAGDTRAFVDLVQRMLKGERVLSMEQQSDAAMRAVERRAMDERITDLENRLRLLGEDPAAARGNPDAMEAYLNANQARLLQATMDDAAARAGDDSPEMDALRERAMQIAADMYEGDRTLAQYEAEVQPLSPVMRRLVQEAQQDAPTTTQAADPEAVAPARGAGDEAGPGTADAGRPAPTVEAARVDADIAARLLNESPDLRVMLPGADEPVPLAEALEMIRAQQALDESGAELVRAAVLCDLTG